MSFCDGYVSPGSSQFRSGKCVKTVRFELIGALDTRSSLSAYHFHFVGRVSHGAAVFDPAVSRR